MRILRREGACTLFGEYIILAITTRIYYTFATFVS